MVRPKVNHVNAVKWAKAKRLYVYGLLPAKVISEITNVTEKTLGTWIKEGNWKKIRNDRLIIKYGDLPVTWLEKTLVIADLKTYIKKRSKDLADKIDPILNDYLKLNS